MQNAVESAPLPTLIFHPNGQLTCSCNITNAIMAHGMIEIGKKLIDQQMRKPQRQVELPPPGLNGESLRG